MSIGDRRPRVCTLLYAAESGAELVILLLYLNLRAGARTGRETPTVCYSPVFTAASYPAPLAMSQHCKVRFCQARPFRVLQNSLPVIGP